MNTAYLLTILEADLLALHVISVIAVLIFALIGTYMYRHRHQLFDRDPQLSEYQDGPGVRHIRLELVLLVWGAVMLFCSLPFVKYGGRNRAALVRSPIWFRLKPEEKNGRGLQHVATVVRQVFGNTKTSEPPGSNRSSRPKLTN